MGLNTLEINNLATSRWRWEVDEPNDPLTIRFTDLSFYEPDTWEWDFDDDQDSDIPSPIHTFPDYGLYHVCQTVEKFQRASQTLKYAQVPTVAAVQGMALGGGCEFVMHAGKRVMALESYIGLVEAGVGLIPAGGGCKEFAVRAADWAAQSNVPGEVFNYLQNAFMTIAMAKVATSAVEAVDFGFAKPSDTILFNANELLFVAIREARAMADAGYAPPPMPRAIPVAGKNGIATFEMMLVNMKEGGMISAHDYKVARSAAIALCGGEVETGSLVDEEWLITVERRLFVELLKDPMTQARIKHMLDTGKPLRN